MIRNRPLEDGTLGVGINGDPYLEEQAVAGAQAFEKLIRSEWRVETCFEGFRFHNVRRWARSVDEINKDLHAIKVVREGIRTTYEVVPLESRRYPSLWLPIPYMEIRKSPPVRMSRSGSGMKLVHKCLSMVSSVMSSTFSVPSFTFAAICLTASVISHFEE